MKETEGLISMKQIQTGPNNMCIIGEWKDEQSIAKARDKMIAGLDTVRPMLEENFTGTRSYGSSCRSRNIGE